MSEPEEKKEEINTSEEQKAVEETVNEEKKAEEEKPSEEQAVPVDVAEEISKNETVVVEETKVEEEKEVEIQKYPRASFVPPLSEDELPHHELTSLHHTFGFPTERRDNIQYIEPNILLYIAGNYLIKLDLTTTPPTRTYVMGVDGRGIGAFVIHPTEPLVVVGEKGADPNIYIFEYPSWKVVKVLKKGAELGYSTLAFSADGSKLASVATGPDFILTIWDWNNEKITLHTKAFGQDIFKVAFSKDDPGRLITSGTGHIRFWRMAKTFTGLKLQGDIGKFGKVELSDVDDFAELPDGKVLSGTESGALLLWEGNFIKYRLMRKDGKTPHDGAVTHVFLIRDPLTSKGVAFVTGGKDGKLCWWEFKEIDEAEIDMDKTTDYEMNPIHEVVIGHGVAVRTIIRGHAKSDTPHALVVDAHGGIWRMNLTETFTATKNRGGGDNGYNLEVTSEAATKLFDFHSGAITAMDTSPVDHFAVTGGIDGTVRCWDYVARKELFKLTWGRNYEEEEAQKQRALKKRRPSRTPGLKGGSAAVSGKKETPEKPLPEPTSVTTLKWAPTNVAPDGRSVFVGFSDGVVRVLWRGTITDSASNDKHSNRWVREQVLKPHSGDVKYIAFSPSGNMFATAGVDGNVFLFIDNKYSASVGFSRPASANGPKSTRKFDPLGFVSFVHNDDPASCAPTSICFRQDGLAMLVTCNDGRIAEVNLNNIVPGGNIVKGSSVLTGESYELNLPIEYHIFKRPKTKNVGTNGGKEENSGGASPQTPGLNFGSPKTPKSPSSNGGASSNPSHVANLFPNDGGDGEEEEEEVELPLPPVLHAVYLRNRGEDALMVKTSDGDKEASKEQEELLKKQQEEEEAAAAAANDDAANESVAAETGGGGGSLGPKVSFSSLPTLQIDTSNTSVNSQNSSNKKNRSKFVVSFGGDLAGNLYYCQFGKDEVIDIFSLGSLSTGTQTSNNAEVFIPRTSCLRYSTSNQFLLTGSSDGSISIRQSGKTGEREDPLEWCYLRIQPHDGDSKVTGVNLSYDNKFLLSAAEDGQMLVQRIKAHGIEPLALSGVVEHKRKATALANAITYTPLAENAEILKDPLVKEAEALKSGKKLAGGDDNGAVVGFGVAVGGAEGEVGPTPKGFEEVESGMESELKNPPKGQKALQEAADIKDANAYTIQDAKLKTDEDQRKEAAEVKKKEVMAAIQQLQKEFEALCAENDTLPPELMLSEDELLVDPELAAILNDKGNEMIEEVYRECAYATEKSERRLMKLGDRFLDPVITEHCSLSTFDLVGTPYARSGAGSKGEVRCSNFVVARPSDELSELLESVSLEMRAEQAGQRAAQNNDPRNRHNNQVFDRGGSQESMQDDSFYGFQDDASSQGEKEKQSLEAQRKERRHLRQAELAKLAEQKPGKHDDDPADIRAIATAEATMGDYKLKAADDYEVADGVVVNKKLKLRELVLYEDAIMMRKNAFNTKFFALRNEKRHTTVSVAQAILRINAITAELGDHGDHDSCTSFRDDGDGKGSIGRSFSQMAGLATQEELPMPPLDAKNEWPSSRHLHTPEELAEFRSLVSEVLNRDGDGSKTDENGKPKDVDLTLLMDALPPLSVVPGLRRGLEVTAEAAARFHAAHGNTNIQYLYFFFY
jgi:WD40 repeat protein